MSQNAEMLKKNHVKKNLKKLPDLSQKLIRFNSCGYYGYQADQSHQGNLGNQENPCN